MTLKKTLFPLLIAAALALVATAPAQADDAGDILGARDAYKHHDDQQLAGYASRLGNSPLAAYPRYWRALLAVEREDDNAVEQYLQHEPPSALSEKIRNEWLKWLGKHELWSQFSQEIALLPEVGRDEETRCYNDLMLANRSKAPADVDRLLAMHTLPEGCNRLIAELARRQLVSESWLLTHVHLLVVAGNASAARDIALRSNLNIDEAFNSRVSPDLNNQASEALLFALLARVRTDPDGAAATLQGEEAVLGPERAKFAWGQLGLVAAKRLTMGQALAWFERADPKQLTPEQWEWWARAALRSGQWAVLESVTRTMPASLAEKPAWRYWRGRALKVLGREAEANPLLAEASRSPGFYGVLSLEELGSTLDTSSSTLKASPGDIERLSTDPVIKRARMLLDIADRLARPELREDARREWRWAMRDKPDLDLLAAAEIARRDGWYDLAIYSAERTKQNHDFSLRYLAPYRDITQRYANQLGVDEAWIYGLIRQESRFVTVARSGVGASGLMQLMPATARWVARKIGLGAYAVNNIDTNIQLGTWYLNYVLQNLGHPVLATAAYNAGPARARAWEGGKPLEGAVYAETIPFNETRDYVQKVMANAAYYASGFGHAKLTLKERLGVIPAR